ncbi:YesL family protein [Gracilibacillus suaedae]|uniref:YesL family protein n=1 Tax=Gracilibacillus suaedae TaxID=2820273 RepID=UPI001ABDCD33|nr:YesL family protein [Gracilibacillus suaedae]
MNALNKAFEWISKVAYLNLLWIGFALFGLIIVGLFPSTVATFSIVRKWVSGNTDVPLFKTFWKVYRQSLLQANILGYIIAVMGYVLYLDFLFVTLVENDYLMLLTIPFLFISIFFILTSFYVFPVYVHYDMKLLQVLKSSFFIMILNPLPTVVMVLGVFGITYGLWHFQGLALFFSMSLIALALTMPAHKAFSKVQEKKAYFTKQKLMEE